MKRGVNSKLCRKLLSVWQFSHSIAMNTRGRERESVTKLVKYLSRKKERVASFSVFKCSVLVPYVMRTLIASMVLFVIRSAHDNCKEYLRNIYKHECA